MKNINIIINVNVKEIHHLFEIGQIKSIKDIHKYIDNNINTLNKSLNELIKNKILNRLKKKNFHLK